MRSACCACWFVIALSVPQTEGLAVLSSSAAKTGISNNKRKSPFFVSKRALYATASSEYASSQHHVQQHQPASSGRITTALVSLSYLATIVAVMTLPSALGSVDKELFAFGASSSSSSSSSALTSSISLSSVIFCASIGTVLGKFLLGTPTDLIGGQKALKLSMFANFALLLLCGGSTSVQAFARYWVLLSFLYGAGWGACGSVIRKQFPQSRWAPQLGIVAAASRFGSLSSSLVFGSILKGGLGSWRKVFNSAAYFQLFAGMTYLLHDLFLRPPSQLATSVSAPDKTAATTSSTTSAATPTTQHESVSSLLKRLSVDSSFWAMLLSKMALMAVGQFIGFQALFCSTGLGMSAGDASSAAATFAAGSLVSNVFGSRVYNKFGKEKKLASIALLNLCGVILPALFAAKAMSLVTFSNTVALVILTLWGAAWALPFYIPPGVYALSVGGIEHAALLTNLFDGFGFIIAAFFSIAAMERGRVGDWAGIMIFLSSAGFVSLVAQFHAMRKTIVTAPSQR